MHDYRTSIIKLLERNKKGLSFDAIRKALRVKGSAVTKALRKELDLLEEEGLILRRGQKYILIASNTEKGYFQRFPAGFGFLLRENKEDVFIPPHATKGAMDGDYVLVAIVKERPGKKPEGRVIQILKRADKRFSGTLRKLGKRFVLEPDDPNLPKFMELAKSKSKREEFKEGWKVVFSVKGGRAQVEEVVGPEDDPSSDYKVVIAKYKLKEDFPSKVLREIKEVKASKKRLDLRDQFIITIDPKDAKDFDDAISVSKDGELYLLGVHIADVSSYVLEDSKLDKEALRRGCSVYLIDKVIPMLPHELSSDLCSLKPGVDRLTMSVFIWIDKNGEVIKRDFANSIINSKARLSYEDAQNILEGKGLSKDSVSIFVGDSFSKIGDFLKLARELAWILRERRSRRGSLDFDLPEPVIELGPYGRVVSVSPSVRLDTHRIIEEFMVKANEVVAEYLEENGFPVVYRVHEPPDEAKIKDFVRIAEGILGVKFNFDKITRFELQEIVRVAEEHGHGPIVSYLLLRSMKRAKYSIKNVGHYGLASSCYAHFTSPIRRYPDLVVHRLLKKALKGEPPSFDEEYLEKLNKIAVHSSEREEISEQAEWELLDLKKLEFLKGRVGEIFEGVVTHLVSSGMFVEIEEFLTEGFVPLRGTTENFELDEYNMQAQIGNKVIKLGDKVKVRVKAVDKWSKSVEFELYEEV